MSPGSPLNSETLLGSETLSPNPKVKAHTEHPGAVSSLTGCRGPGAGPWKVVVFCKMVSPTLTCRPD